MNEATTEVGEPTKEAQTSGPDDAQTSPTGATPAETRADMTRLAARGYFALRHLLVQRPDGDERGSTLGQMVHGRRHRALLLYLLLLTCWPWLSKNYQPLPAATWIRALTAKGGLTWTPSTLSRAWADLEQLGLIERDREGRALRVRPRREDGAEPYDAPGGRSDRQNTYFILPDTFWNDEVFAQLSLPGLAMLLIVAKETNAKKEMYLPYSRSPVWYGISEKTAQKGLKDLDSLGLLHRRESVIKAPLSATGLTVRVWYSLTGDFGTEARMALRKKARTERRKRLGEPLEHPTASGRSIVRRVKKNASKRGRSKTTKNITPKSTDA